MTFKNYRSADSQNSRRLINDFREFGYKLDVVYGNLVCWCQEDYFTNK